MNKSKHGRYEQVNGAVANALIEENDYLRTAIEEMPAVVLEFLNEEDYSSWIAWRNKYFNQNGKLVCNEEKS